MIIISFALLQSGRLIKKALPLIAFSFTIILTIFLIHGLVNQQNKNVLFAIGFLKFYKEGLLYAAHIGLNILNMLLSFAIVVLSTRPSELVDELERKGFSPRFGYIINSVIPDHSTDDGNHAYDHGCAEKPWHGDRRKSSGPHQSVSSTDFSGGHECTDSHPGARDRSGSAGIWSQGTKTWMHPTKKQKQTGFSAGYVSSV